MFVTAKAAQSIGIAIHELATNAAKYGALSDHRGHVRIDRSVEKAAIDGPRFVLGWIVEDEIFLAFDIADQLRDAGFEVVGPVATVAKAQKLIREEPIRPL